LDERSKQIGEMLFSTMLRDGKELLLAEAYYHPLHMRWEYVRDHEFLASFGYKIKELQGRPKEDRDKIALALLEDWEEETPWNADFWEGIQELYRTHPGYTDNLTRMLNHIRFPAYFPVPSDMSHLLESN
jgi:hypothetical protein